MNMRLRTGARVGSRWMGARMRRRANKSSRRRVWFGNRVFNRSPISTTGFGLALGQAAKYKFRGPGSMTSMMPGGRTPIERVTQVGDGNTRSVFVRKALKLRGLTRRVMNTAPMRAYKTEIASSLTWNVGQQGILTNIYGTIANFQTITGLVSTNETTRTLFLNTTTNWMITNGTKAGVKLKIYEGVYKKNVVSGFSPYDLWRDGLVDTGTTQTPTDVNSIPFQSKAFNDICHVTKVYNVYLPQGRTHEHVSVYNWNKIWDRTLGGYTGCTYAKGWSRFAFFVFYGEPVADTDADVTTASGRVLLVATRTTRYKYNLPENYVSTYTKSIPITGISAERLLDEGSGEVETNAVI